MIDKGDHKQREASGSLDLVRGKSYPIKAEYVHRDGAGAHVRWSGPGFEKRPMRLDGH